jgi:phospholipid/cholesterol/gamma-HCH transport system ATP-binding protein
MLRVDSLSAAYGRRTILQDVCMQVQPGEVRVILGGSGCGKTTLLKHLVGLLRPQAGVVELLGVNFWAAEESQRTEVLGRVGMLFQAGALLGSLTVLQNVCLPLRQRTGLPLRLIEEMAYMKLEQVSLAEAAGRFPAELSGGMRKRVALARAMALDPQILLCDEPSAGLDPTTAVELDRLILQLRERFGMTFVIVSHELASIEALADRVLMLADGRVIADGPLSEVKRQDDPRVSRFFNRQPRPIASGAAQPTVLDALQRGLA